MHTPGWERVKDEEVLRMARYGRGNTTHFWPGLSFYPIYLIMHKLSLATVTVERSLSAQPRNSITQLLVVWESISLYTNSSILERLLYRCELKF